MKILYRGEGTLRWLDCIWDGINYTVEGENIPISSIVSIRDAKKAAYVKCSGCGEIIRNTPKTIEKHKKRGLDSSFCLECPNLGVSPTNTEYRHFKKEDNGLYSVTEKTTCKLRCNNGYYSGRPEIGTAEARNRCKYRNCAEATFSTEVDFLTKYPGAFDDMITVDKIIQNKYSRRYVRDNGEIYYIKARNSIEAYVNKQNIVTHFKVSYKNHSSTVYYSPKYNKLFCPAYPSSYAEWKPCHGDVPRDVQERIKNKIASLYN